MLMIYDKFEILRDYELSMTPQLHHILTQFEVTLDLMFGNNLALIKYSKLSHLK
jgi:hypothetical protein